MKKETALSLLSYLLFVVLLGVGIAATAIGSKGKSKKKDKKTVRQKIGQARDKAGELGEQLIAGAEQLKNATTLLEQGKKQLQERLVAGLESMLKGPVNNKIADIRANRQQIAHFKKIIEMQKGIAEEAGKGALIRDMLEGLTEADAALAMIYDEASHSGILIDFRNASNSAVQKTGALVVQLDGYIRELDKKIQNKKFCLGRGLKCTLPERLQRLGNAVKRLSKKKKK